MQTLGLSDSTPRPESRWQALFWPTIRHEYNLDYITRQGFWICAVVAVMNLVVSAFAGSLGAGAFESLFFFLAGIGVRERSRVAGIAVFAVYLLGGLVLQRYTHNGFSILRIIFPALLFANVRGNRLAARLPKEPAEALAGLRLHQTLADKLSDQLPALVWPKPRYLFYLLAVVELALLLFALFGPLPGAASGDRLSRADAYCFFGSFKERSTASCGSVDTPWSRQSQRIISGNTVRSIFWPWRWMPHE